VYTDGNVAERRSICVEIDKSESVVYL
jgi:hypothetical protein